MALYHFKQAQDLKRSNSRGQLIVVKVLLKPLCKQRKKPKKNLMELLDLILKPINQLRSESFE